MTTKTKPKNVRRLSSYYDPTDETREAFPRVTDVCGVMAKPGLENWKIKTHAEAVAAWPDLSWDEVKVKAREKMEVASRKGSALHKLLEVLLEQGPGAINADEIPPLQLDQFNQIREWWDTNSPELTYSEVTVFSRTYGYAGTLDFIVLYPGDRLFLGDLKTGKGVYEEAAWQMSAYKHADYLIPKDQLLVENPVVEDIPDIDGMYVLHTPEGKPYSWLGQEDRFDSFLAALHLYRRANGLGCKPACPLDGGRP